MNTLETLRICLKLERGEFQLKVDLTLPANGITVLFGASGSGKTTLLRCVAGLERPTEGLIRVGQALWQDSATRVFAQPWQRDLGYVFQEASLFEHLAVHENLVFGQKRSKKAGSAKALKDAIELLGIGHLMRRQAASLSGGERQRVAIARALATQPRLLLLDEPLAALDLARRLEILPWLERLRDEMSMPMLYVTHSVDEVARLADHLVVLDGGSVKVRGAVQDVFSRIDSPVIIGDDAGVLLHGYVRYRDEAWHLAKIEFSGGGLWVRDNDIPLGKQVRLRVLARDVSIAVDEPRDTSIQNHLQGRIEAIADDVHPSQAMVQIRCEESIVLARITKRAISALNLQKGMTIWVQVKSVAVIE